MPPPADRLVFNGVNAATGDYLLPPLPAEVIGRVARGEKPDPRLLAELKWRHRQDTTTYRSVKAGVDPKRLDESGWGAVFPHTCPPAVVEALRPLLDHRKAQAGPLYREYAGHNGYRPGDGKLDFLNRHHAGPGPVDPAKVPYYLLLVGGPEAIPYRFQYQLDVQYAVGRVAFDTPEEYANYARSVVEAETRPARRGRTVAFFAPANPGDRATAGSSADLAAPLAAAVAGKFADWQVSALIGERATKAALAPLLGGPDTPAVLFTAGHGVGFPSGHPRQARHQGALLCQDWPGPDWTGPVPEAHYFSADDVAAGPAGLIAFAFACYGAGTPHLDDFARSAFGEDRAVLAPHDLVAGLPRRLLGHPAGGALAVVGHVDRAWGYSFHWPTAGRQLAVFESALQQLLEGYPVGAALEFFNGRYAELSANLADELERAAPGRPPDDAVLAALWTANNDARNFVVLGDPAVRVAAAPPAPRPTVTPAEPIVLSQTPDNPPAEQPPILAVVAATEQRYRDRAANPPSIAFSPGAAPVLQTNPPDRVRKRLARLGLPPAEIDAVAAAGPPSFAVLGADPSPVRVGLERILGRSNLIGVEFLTAAVAAARAVGRVVIRSDAGRVLGYGSGALVSPRLFVTNNHVLGSAGQAAASAVEFGYEHTPGGALRAARAAEFDPEAFFLTDPVLDFTLVAVRAADGLAEFGHLTLNEDDGAVLTGEAVNIVQHPGGRPKQVVLRDNRVTDVLPDFLHYRADTEPGSSGAPVFNDQWELVGLHHSGVPKRDDRGRVLARGGGVWAPGMGEVAIDWAANEGVRAGRILAYVRRTVLADGQAAARDELLAAVIRRPGLSASNPPERLSSQGRSGAVLMSARTASAEPGPTVAGPTVHIPIHVTVSVTGAGVPTVTVGVPSSAVDGDFAEAISIDPDYDSREGYDSRFLGTGSFAVPLPILPAALKADAAQNRRADAGADPHVLPYHHYSVVLNARRRLAFFTAVNIDGRSTRSPKREKDKWFFDPRVGRDEQIGNDLYEANPFDRGHLVRRLDPAWGRSPKVVKVANDDTFHFTNCSPQHERFNQGKNLWAGLEDHLLNKATAEERRLTVFTGPVFRSDDRILSGVQIPKEFWKVAVYAKTGAGLVAAAFLVSQEKLIKSLTRPVGREASAEDVAETFQTTVAAIERLTNLDFGALRDADVNARAGVSFAPGEIPMVPLTDESQIQVE
ncbi:MAG TPA: DNA/RNA non-specific endonuclease [Gemmataceae bacterium]|nr:DNA/RNA non-specific endonuclease [Gemmataceae bacterium]